MTHDSVGLARDFTGKAMCRRTKHIRYQTLETKDCTGRADEIIVGGSFPLQLRVRRYNFSRGDGELHVEVI